MLDVNRHDAVLRITLNRPEKRNALHPELIRDLGRVLGHTKHDESVRTVVITGAGSAFCAGLDLQHLSTAHVADKVAYMRNFFSLFQQTYNLPQPVIAAVNGPAIAGGFDLAAACDLRLCCPNASFAQTEVSIGITQMLFPLYKVIGLGRAKELALTGSAISAVEAYRIGFANHLFPAEELLEEAMKLATLLASRPKRTLFETKRLSREVIDMDTGSAMKRMFDAISERLSSDEHRQETEKYLAALKQRRSSQMS